MISSDCNNGPREFLEFKNNGFLFKSNSKHDLKKKILEFINSDETNIKNKKLNALKESRKFSFFKHYSNLNNLLINEN